MDRPGALAVKLNTRDRKGSGAHPGYGPKLGPATDRGPACPHQDTRICPVLALAKGCARLAPCHPSPSLGVSPAGGAQAEEGTGTASSLPIIGADLREHLERPWGRAVRRAAGRGAAAAGSGRCRRSCSSRFSGVVTHRPMEGRLFGLSVCRTRVAFSLARPDLRTDNGTAGSDS